MCWSVPNHDAQGRHAKYFDSALLTNARLLFILEHLAAVASQLAANFVSAAILRAPLPTYEHASSCRRHVDSSFCTLLTKLRLQYLNQ